jgi:hypothetical protein
MHKSPALIVVLCAVTSNACVPSFQYRLGQGFYSANLAKTQVQAAANAGKVRNLGRFSVTAGACGNYSQDMTDRHIIFPAIQEKLKEMGANVADNVVANEKWYDFLLGLLIIPALLACSNWEISGEALRVEEGAMKESPTIVGGSLDRIWIFFKHN